MADDNRNLEDQLNILFDDFDDEVEEISEKAAETVSRIRIRIYYIDPLTAAAKKL